MSLKSLDPESIVKSLSGSADYLKLNYKILDNLNIFPVPDGDTGTNMLATFEAGVKELLVGDKIVSLNKIAQIMDVHLLHESRGNSGFILARFFHGFFSIIKNKEEVNALNISDGFHNGLYIVNTSLLNPIEGTMITVMAAMCDLMAVLSKKNPNCELSPFLDLVIIEAHKVLLQTPDLLPVLAKAGVIDSGALGFIFIVKGFLYGMINKKVEIESEKDYRFEPITLSVGDEIEKIVYQYCTEVIIKKFNKQPIDGIKEYLSERGDSIALIDDAILKIHIHTNDPQEILDYFTSFGTVEKSKIDDMFEQVQLVSGKNDDGSQCSVLSFIPGSGFAPIFFDLGVNHHILYKEDLPSTGEILKYIENIPEKNIIILPNNNNILPALMLAREKSEKNLTIIQTKNVIEGITSTYGFSENESIQNNVKNMKECISMAKSLFVYKSVSQTVFDGVNINKDDYFVLQDKSISAVHPEISQAIMIAIKGNQLDELGNISFYYNDSFDHSILADIKNEILGINEYLELEEHYGDQHREELIISME